MAALPTRTITAANALITITIPGVLVSPATLSQFAADDIYESDEIETAEALMGVDGTLSAGYVNVAIPQRFMFQANSPSLDIFDNWYLAQKTIGDTFSAFMEIELSATKRKYVCNNGILRNYKVLPDAKRVLQPRAVRILWQEVLPAQIA